MLALDLNNNDINSLGSYQNYMYFVHLLVRDCQLVQF